MAQVLTTVSWNGSSIYQGVLEWLKYLPQCLGMAQVLTTVSWNGSSTVGVFFVGSYLNLLSSGKKETFVTSV